VYIEPDLIIWLFYLTICQGILDWHRYCLIVGMKVKELIKLLEKEDQELEVVQFHSYEYEHDFITRVDYRTDLETGYMTLKEIESVKRGAIQIL